MDRPLENARSCHCSRCRKAFSSAGSAYAECAPGSFRWLAGADAITTYGTSKGAGLVFCSICGTTLCGMLDGRVHGVTLGSVDGGVGFRGRAGIAPHFCTQFHAISGRSSIARSDLTQI